MGDGVVVGCFMLVNGGSEVMRRLDVRESREFGGGFGKACMKSE
jgi:hypothetical protein